MRRTEKGLYSCHVDRRARVIKVREEFAELALGGPHKSGKDAFLRTHVRVFIEHRNRSAEKLRFSGSCLIHAVTPAGCAYPVHSTLSRFTSALLRPSSNIRLYRLPVESRLLQSENSRYGFHAATDVSDASFAIPGSAPDVRVLSPHQDSSFLGDVPLVLPAWAGSLRRPWECGEDMGRAVHECSPDYHREQIVARQQDEPYGILPDSR